jgi:light-regulated signal transduction histidine kinase (bacteriophytochrome)
MPLVMGGGFVGILNLHPSEGSRPITLGQLKTFRVFATAAASVVKVSSLLQALQTSNVALEERVAGRTAQLERANQDLEAFSYSVSHDLRAPLRTIDGFTRLVLEDFAASIPDTAKRSLDSVCRATQRMNELIDALLELSQVTRKPLSSERVDMRTLALEVIEELAGEHKTRDVEVVVGALPACNGDRALLHQVFFNLLANAFKFTRQRARTKIEVDSANAGREVTYYVRDNGSGFDSARASRLFDPFQRLHAASDFEGSGIGLSIVQRIVTRHGGRVWAEAKVDQGATFCFSLPRA